MQINGIVKLLYSNDYLFVVFSDKKQPKQFGKSQKNEKIQFRNGDVIFSNLGKMYKF